MEPAPIAPALLPSGTDPSSVEQFLELSEEESALRHRLELRVERAFLQAALVLQELQSQMPDDLPYYALKDSWRNSDKVKRAFDMAARTLGELRDRQLYRSTHRYFDQYYYHRFGSFVEEYLPAPQPDSAPPSISGQ